MAETYLCKIFDRRKSDGKKRKKKIQPKEQGNLSKISYFHSNKFPLYASVDLKQRHLDTE